MELVIEQVGRGSRHFEFQQVSGERITIGRGYDNDIILSDPHICPHHAEITTNDKGEIILRDLKSVNGTHTKKHQPIQADYVITSGEEVIIGKTHIRIFQHDHAITPSVRLNIIEQVANTAGKPWVTALAFILVVLLNILLGFSEQLKEFHTGRMLIYVMDVVLMIVVWVTGWSIYARLKKHELRLFAQLTVSLVFILLSQLNQELVDWLNFHTGSSTAVDIISVGVAVALVISLIWMNFYLSGFQSPKTRWLYSSGLTVLFMGFAYVVVTIDSDRFAYRPNYYTSLYPPSIIVYPEQSIADYLKNAEKVFAEVDESIE